jgi:hypothetical protein
MERKIVRMNMLRKTGSKKSSIEKEKCGGKKRR